VREGLTGAIATVQSTRNFQTGAGRWTQHPFLAQHVEFATGRV